MLENAPFPPSPTHFKRHVAQREPLRVLPRGGPRGAAQRQQQLPCHDHDLGLAVHGDAAKQRGAEDEVQRRGVPGASNNGGPGYPYFQETSNG